MLLKWSQRREKDEEAQMLAARARDKFFTACSRDVKTTIKPNSVPEIRDASLLFKLGLSTCVDLWFRTLKHSNPEIFSNFLIGVDCINKVRGFGENF